MNQREYAQIQARMQRQMEAKFIASVYRALRNQISSFTRNVRSVGLARAEGELRSVRIDTNMAAVIKKIHLTAGVMQGKKVRAQLRIDAAKSKRYNPPMQLKRGFGFNERLVSDIQEYFRLFLLEKAVLPISVTTRTRIETVLRTAVQEGWGVDEILRHLEGPEFREMTRRRARTIVRTETVRASNFGGMAAAWDDEYETEKEWIEVKDRRTRNSHRHATGVGGEVRDLLTKFSNGLQFPGDPDAPASEVVMCRCSLGYNLKRDVNGNLIPKQNIGQPLANQINRRA